MPWESQKSTKHYLRQPQTMTLFNFSFVCSIILLLSLKFLFQTRRFKNLHHNLKPPPTQTTPPPNLAWHVPKSMAKSSPSGSVLVSSSSFRLSPECKNASRHRLGEPASLSCRKVHRQWQHQHGVFALRRPLAQSPPHHHAWGSLNATFELSWKCEGTR